MNLIVVKTSFYLVSMIALLMMAFITNDTSNGQLFAALGIMTGSFAFKSLSGITKVER